jgi:hypothetical protein
MSFWSKLTATVSHWFITTDPVVVTKEQLRQAREVLWREWRYSDNGKIYAQNLRFVILLTDIWPDYWDQLEQSRPLAMEVEAALWQICQVLSQAQEVWADPLGRLAARRQQPVLVEQLLTELQTSNWIDNFVARHTLVYLGGQAVGPLVNLAVNEQSALRHTALWLLRSIEADTTARLGSHFARLVCPHCLVRYYPHEIWMTDKTHPLAYYGCRACGQSREFLEWPGQIVTVLDRTMTESYVEQKDVIRGNWLKLRALFDCNRVEIIQATDEDVERFAVQVGNDTDELRQPRYAKMSCMVACQLSENTQRILQHTFGRVEGEVSHE